MSQHDDMDETRAALIDHRIGQSFEFLGDVIAEPRLLDAIPDGSKLAFRDVTICGDQFRLTAFQAPEAGGHWGALVTGHTQVESQVGTSTCSAKDRVKSAPVDDLPDIQFRKSAQSALDALEAELRTLITIPA
jgi:hypothetical protein